jgi:UDP-N-acetylmuramoyl-tripeptide--D-alanyl-D-alanine ligase
MFPVEEIARIVGGDLLLAASDQPTRAIHDSRLVRPGDLFIALPGHHADGHDYLADAFRRGACAAMVTATATAPKEARNLIVVDDAARALQALASAWRDTLTAPCIAVTGTNGKTTVKGLLGHMLSAHGPTHVSPHNYNTEIGLPIALLSMPTSARYGVFELGAEYPGDIRQLARILRPHIGVITSIGPGHLDRLATVDAVASEKWALVEELPETGAAILHANSSHLMARASMTDKSVITAGLNEGDLSGQVLQAVPHLIVHVNQHPEHDVFCRLVGEHNAVNLLLAAAAADALGVDWNSIRAQAASFEPLPHRLHPTATSFGTVLDDTYNANPVSMAAALHVLASFGDTTQTRAFVFGEMLGLGADTDRYHREVLRLALDLPVDLVLPVGHAAVSACRADGHPKIAIVPRDNVVAYVRQHASPASVVLVKGSRALQLETLVDQLLAGDQAACTNPSSRRTSASE